MKKIVLSFVNSCKYLSNCYYCLVNNTKENKMKNNQYKIGEKVWVNLASFMPKSTLDDDGSFKVWGTIIGFTSKRIIVDCEGRGIGYYKPNNISKVKPTIRLTTSNRGGF
jgi:hypothetical protein